MVDRKSVLDALMGNSSKKPEKKEGDLHCKVKLFGDAGSTKEQEFLLGCIKHATKLGEELDLDPREAMASLIGTMLINFIIGDGLNLTNEDKISFMSGVNQALQQIGGLTDSPAFEIRLKE
jgi:hypothetical protein